MIPINVFNELTYFGLHNHTDRSNFRLKDCINKVETLIDYARGIGMAGLAITDHEALSAHVEAVKYAEKFDDFKVALGNEIYLVERGEIERAREANEPTRFYHFILVAKNENGYKGLKELSSLAWQNSFFYRGMERVPTYTDDFERILTQYKGDIIASTACIGSEFARAVIDYARTSNIDSKRKIHRLINWYKSIFDSNFYIELQPSKQEEQIIYNKMAMKVAQGYGIKTIFTTDAHYLNKEQAIIHESYLKADEGEREVAEFYSTTYVMSVTELWEFFEPYIDADYFKNTLQNTLDIMNQVEPIKLKHETVVPKRPIPEFELSHLFSTYYDKYEYIRKFAYSPNIEDRFHLYLVEKGFVRKNEEFNEVNLSRLNEEYKELWLTSENLGQPISSYYILVEDIINLMWQVSLVGPGRGSAASWYTVYLMGITQLNPIQYKLPHWRHLTHERPELPDIDIDTEASQRENILNLIKERYGWENVLNISTKTTEKLRSSILTSCRGLGIDNDVAQNIANLIPTDKTGMWTLKECLEGDEETGKKPIKELQEEFDKYPGLRETVETIEGLVSGRSVHASGIYIFRDGYLAQNAMMKTTGGQWVTQFDMSDSDYMGGLKMDALTINALDRIRTNLELLLKAGKIEWQGSLRKTYDKYIHPDVLDFENQDMYKLLHDGHILDAFQFDSAVGSQAVSKIKPISFLELSAGNSLMRLSPEGGESPLDKYVRHKANVQEWYDEMNKAQLNEDEVKVLEYHLLDNYGMCDTQESMMLISMDPKVSGFNLTQANKLRKGVAKKKKEILDECAEMFYSSGLKIGTRKELLDYVWEVLFRPQFGYSFSLPHIASYTMILMQELNLAHRYGVIYWITACLTVNSGLIGEREGNTDYGAVAKAVGDMKGVVLNPDINRSELGFTPLENEGKILFGLKPISGLGKDAVQIIMERRPFTSFKDFYERCIVTQEVEEGQEKISTISDAKAITLIKAGCFDNLEPNKKRRALMIDFVNLTVKDKEKLTMVQLPHIIDKVPREFMREVQVYEFRNKLFGRNKVPMTKEIEQEFKEFIEYYPLCNYQFVDGKLVVDQKSFDKQYKNIVEPLRQWVIGPEAVDFYNKKQKREFWQKHCMGTQEQWEMETVVFYSDKHEMDYIPLENYFDISNFFNLEPTMIDKYNNYRGRPIPQFKTSIIAGTVVDKNKDKHIVYVSTQFGVVPVKYHKGAFLHYDKKVVDIRGNDKIVLDPSWFSRGTKLVIVGYRRNDEFVPRVYKDTPYENSTMKIKLYTQDDVKVQLKKVDI
ncbi:MAG TPA: PHP domain-containing protein [Pseudoneobacillus sp.]|nr:PHP domain-containing protein [Pseudoneobacillus sp.]